VTSATTRRALPILALAGSIVFPVVVSDATAMTVAVWTLLFLGGACAWNLFSGFTGYFTLGNSAFYGVGAYTAALLAEHWHVPGGYREFLLLPLAGLAAAAISVPVAWISLRVQPMIFAVVTIAVFFIAQLLVVNLRSLTHGSQGVQAPFPPWGPGFFNIPFYYAGLAVGVAALATSWAIRRSRYGLELVAIREDEDRLRGLGIPTLWRKSLAFGISAFFVGMVGGVFALYSVATYPQFAFDPNFDLTVIACVLLGGMGTIYGPVVGVLLIVPLQQYVQIWLGVSGWSLVVYGAIFLTILLYLPEGIIPTLARRSANRRHARAAQSAVAARSLVGQGARR
jgi:branched-chain amino acid transport system permease protein